MIHVGSVLELSNNKKYIVSDSTLENGKIYYMTLEVDYESEMPTENSFFFKENGENSLVLIKNLDDIEFLKTIFVNKFLDDVMGEE